MEYKMLIVEDNKFTSEILTTIFEGFAFDMHTIADGSQVLPYIEQNRPDIVILDLELPGMTGDQIYVAVRHHSNPDLRELPIVPFTAHKETDVAGSMPGILVCAAWNTTKDDAHIVFKSKESGENKNVHDQLIEEVISALYNVGKPPTMKLVEWYAKKHNIHPEDVLKRVM